MNERPPSDLPRKPAPPRGAEPHPPGFNLSRDEIYFTLFRHKWLIACFAIAGILGASLFYVLEPSTYRSEAKLLVRYVFDAKANEGVGTESQIRAPGSSGENIINSEIEILTSLDLFEQVASTVGPDKVLRRPASTNETRTAGGLLRAGITVDVPKNSNVIKVGLQHRDPEVATRALTQLIEAYLRRHVEVHRAIGVFDSVLSAQSDQFRSRLAQTENKLRELKTNFVGVSIDDARKALTEQLSKIRQDIFIAEAQLAESFAAGWRNSPAITNLATATNAASPTNIVAAEPSPSPSTMSEYRSLYARLDALRSQELDLRSHYKDENSLLKNVRQQIIETEVRKGLLEKDYPSLLRAELAVATGALSGTSPDTERLRMAGLHAKYLVLTNQMAQLKAEIGILDSIEGEVERLQRTKELEEKNYRYYAAGIEQARFDEALAGGKLANISIIQAPTPPFRFNTKRSKTALGILAAGILGGLSIAFLFELVLDRTLKRPGDFEERLHIPLFVSIPSLLEMPSSLPRLPLLEGAPASGQAGEAAIAPPTIWSSGHALRPFFEELRDRVLLNFEGNTKKPKLIGVTACARGSGVTTTAVGIASSLSETGTGSVLLVDLNLENHAAHPFFQGRPGCGLADAIEVETRHGGQVTENLYLAHARNGGGTGDSFPHRLSQLVPRLRLSDYDYIVFDMPRITHTGVTARLAGMMDLVLVVAEAQKDQRDVLDRALRLLTSSGARVAGVLNKVQRHVPLRFRSHYYESTSAP